MQSDKKPVEKRHIGPAMQWAKPRSASERLRDRAPRRIDIDFEGDSETAQHVSYEGYREGSFGSTDTEPRANESSTVIHNAPGSYSANSTHPQGNWNQPSHSDSVNTGSAWEYYSGNSYQDSQESINTAGAPRGRNYTHFNDVGYEYPHQVEAPNYNARSTDITTTVGKSNDGPGIRQFLFPILVVGIIVIAGLLASFGQ